MAEGRIKWYSPQLGHGFIRCVGGLKDPYIFHTLGTTPISTPTRQKHP
jgi:hypothetical protein